MDRPGWEDYFMKIASDVSLRSNCSRRHIGAVIVGPHHEIVSTGYNGTPAGTTNCYEGGCPRCAGDAEPGTGYDLCLCVHAEENAMLLCSRDRLWNHMIVVTARPCIICLRHIIVKQIKVVLWLYDNFTLYDAATEKAYYQLANQGELTIKHIPTSELE